MTVENNVFPQSGDADFAENFATWLGRGNVTDYVETGLDFTVDYGASPPTVDVSQGKAFVVINEATISSNNETRLVLDYVVTFAGTTGVTLTDSEANNLVYLNPNIGSNDSPSIEVETSSGNAGASWLLIGEIDTVADTSQKLNRNPDASFENLSVRDSIDIPTYSDFSEADASESSTIYIDGTGAPTKGLYVHDGSGFISAGVREIDELLDVDGITSVSANSLGNRPAAGEQGRLFIDESNNRIQLDTGSAWVDIGTNSTNIGAGDLGFDPATQTELDNHAADSDIHHSRPVAGNGIKDQSNNFNIEPSDFVGQFLNDNSDNIDVEIGFGLENDGSGQIQFNEDASYTFSAQQFINNVLTMSDNIDLGNNNLIDPNQIQTSGSGSDVITFRDTNSASDILTLSEGGEVGVTSGDLTNGSGTVIYDQSSSHVPLSVLEFDSVTVSAGDGLKSGGTAALGSSVTLNIEPNEFAGSGLVDDGSDNLALSQDSITVSAGDGLKSGGTASLGGSVTLNLEPNDFAGTFLSDDGTDNLTVDIGAGLSNDGAGNIELTNDSVTVSAGDGLKSGGTVALGGSVSLDVEPDNFAGTFLSDDGADNLTVNISDGLENDGTGNIRVDENFDFTFLSTIDFSSGLDTQGDISDGGQTIWDASAQEVPDSALGSITNSTLSNSSVTVSAGDGLKSGGSVALGGSVTLDVEPSNFAGTFLSDDGADNLTVNISDGLENDGTGNIRVDENFDFTFTTSIDFNSGLDTQGDITDGTQVIWDVSAQEIPDSALGSIANSTLSNSSITVSAGDGLKSGGNVSLGGSVGLNVEPNDFAGAFLSDDGADNLQVNDGTGLESDGSDNLRVDEAYDFTFTSTVDFSSGFDTQGDITDGTQTIWDASIGEIPDSAIGSIANSTLTNSGITINANNGLKSGGSVSLGSSVGLDVEPTDFAGAGLNDDGADNLELTENSVTITAGTDLTTGGTVALGSSVTIDHADTSTQSNVAAGAGAAVTDVDLDGNGHVTALGTTNFDSRYVTESGDTMSGDLSLGGNALTGTTAIFSSGTMAFNTGGGGQENIVFQDLSTSTPTRIMQLNEGSQDVQIRNGDLEVGNTSGGDIRASGELTEGASL